MTRVNANYVLVTPVWGSYVEVFLKICLPSLLAEGNVPALQAPCIYLIYTTSHDASIIQTSSVYKKLCKIIDVQFKTIDVALTNAYLAITWCHQEAFNFADHRDAGIFVVMPDQIYSNNFCSHMQKLINQGARLISVPGFKINLEDSLNELLDYSTQDQLSIGAQNLAQIGMRNLHAFTRAQTWNDDYRYCLPNILFWRLPNNGGMLGRFFYGCFCYVHPQIKFNKLYATMDVDYIYHACPDPTTHRASLDSSDALVLELDSKYRSCAGFPKGFQQHVKFYAECLNCYQINHSKHLFKIVTGTEQENDWQDAIAVAEQIFEDVY